ncbi:hypothetical protein OKA04_01205 [Luteolibacter flavescens]|uniref:Uncharacterized protein n=1 Tax=Luteolibacter flavescens TaxID=1859460 RepID=A0ABT3FJ76_9BACT|nr:hypothetical protein [Luteolibacter flavescens]MCW1883326.1 hypothetical protein [Luteolibacter flavescens]
MRFKSVVAACGLLLAGIPAASAQGDYLEWAGANGLMGPLAEPDADLDTDGITNLMAYAFDLAPANDPDAWEKLPSLAFLGDPPEPVMTFVLPREIPRDVSYVVELVREDGKRVEIARKNGRGPWKGTGEIFRRKLDDGCTEITVETPLDMPIPEGDRPLRLRVEFLP